MQPGTWKTVYFNDLLKTKLFSLTCVIITYAILRDLYSISLYIKRN
jgi:hypothetical protein